MKQLLSQMWSEETDSADRTVENVEETVSHDNEKSSLDSFDGPINPGHLFDIAQQHMIL